MLCQCPSLSAAIHRQHLYWPSLPSIFHPHCPMLALALAYPGSWSALTVSFFDFLSCAASFTLALAASNIQFNSLGMIPIILHLFYKFKLNGLAVAANFISFLCPWELLIDVFFCRTFCVAVDSLISVSGMKRVRGSATIGDATTSQRKQ
jgi:hypothetical protein